MAPSRPHRLTLRFPYADEQTARIVADAISVEVGGVDDDRSTVSVHRDGVLVEVTVAASDLTALRAGVNSWLRYLRVAEETLAVTSSAPA